MRLMHREILQKEGEERGAFEEKMERVKQAVEIIRDFDEFVNESGNWDTRFEMT